MMEAINTSETPVNISQTTMRNIQADRHLDLPNIYRSFYVDLKAGIGTEKKNSRE
jgi:hypothetical protein